MSKDNQTARSPKSGNLILPFAAMPTSPILAGVRQPVVGEAPISTLIYADTAGRYSIALAAGIADLGRTSVTVHTPLDAIGQLQDDAKSIGAVFVLLQDAGTDISAFFSFLEDEHPWVRRIAFAHQGSKSGDSALARACQHDMILWDPWDRDDFTEILKDALDCRVPRMRSGRSDAELIEWFQGTDTRAFAEILRRHRHRPAAQDETRADRLRGTTTPDAMSVDFVSAFAGDRDMTQVERARARWRMEKRGSVFFSDLLYAISHHYFAPEVAEVLWSEVVRHKHMMSERLDRNVRITVGALDYLSNITDALKAPTLIPEAYVSEIANLSMRDGMTGLFNNSTCHELLELEFRSFRRYGVGVSLLLLDIDDFKSINDQRGHQEGDRILVELARALTEEARDSDICCRLGGDEFGVILRLTSDPVEACDIAERIRAGVARIASGRQPIAVSIGVALCDHAVSSPRALVERADQALYKAKKGGKNQVFLSTRNRT